MTCPLRVFNLIINCKESHSFLTLLSPNFSSILYHLVGQRDSPNPVCSYSNCLKNSGLGAGSLLSLAHNIAILLSQKTKTKTKNQPTPETNNTIKAQRTTYTKIRGRVVLSHRYLWVSDVNEAFDIL